MTFDFAVIRTTLESLRTRGLDYFDNAIGYAIRNDTIQFGVPNPLEPDIYWSKLEENEQQISTNLQTDLLRVVQQIANCVKQSSLLTEADRRDLGTWTKSLRASLRLRKYHAWETEVLHDEGHVLGVQPAGQSDTEPAHPEDARRNFDRDISNLLKLVDILEVSPTLSVDAFRINPQATVDYKSDSAFVMMQIDSGNPKLEDVYETIKECCAKFKIAACRADEIEHEGVITSKILEEIKSSEFLIADLTGERPSVYYEIGYAHSLGRRVVMYREQNTKVHFDLAAYNCPEYNNQTDLRKKLMKRLESMTNRKP